MAAVEIITEVDALMQAVDQAAARAAINAEEVGAGGGGPNNAIKVDPNIFAIKDLTGDGSASQILDLFHSDDGGGNWSKLSMGYGKFSDPDVLGESPYIHGRGAGTASNGQLNILIEGGGIALAIADNNVPFATGTASLAIGHGTTKATGSRVIALGGGCEAKSADGISAGTDCLTESINNFAFASNSRITAAGNYSMVAGANALCDRRTSIILGGGGGLTKGGSFQSGRTCAKADTTDATPVIMMNYGTNVVLRTNTSWAFQVLVSAHRTDVVGDCAGYLFTGMIHRVGSTTSMVGTPNKTVLGEVDTAWDCDVVADDAINSLAVTVTGAVGKTIRWVATIDTAEAGS